MLQHFFVGCEERGVEDRVDFPPRGDLEVESHL